MLLPILAALGCSRNREPAPLPAITGSAEAIAPVVTASAAASSALPSAAASATAALVAPTAVGPAKYPLRWAASLKLNDVAAIAAARSEKKKTNGEALSLTRGEGAAAQKVSVEDCAQYQKAVEEGFEPQTTFDISQESFFKARCTPLRFLTEARPSAESWVKDLRLDKDPLALLPASMNLDMEGPSDDQKAAIGAGARLNTYSPKLVVKRKAADAVVFLAPESKVESTVDVVAFGDLDHDGIEDVLLFQTLHSLEGSLRSYHHLVATRKGADQPLVILRSLDR
jgi:hypothetical protein